MKTISERLFEEFCSRSSLCSKRLPEGVDKTPDYELSIGRQRIIVEVKEVERNPVERESDRVLAETGLGLCLTSTPGDRVRKKIADASAQIKARTQGELPSLLVLFDRGLIFGHLDPYSIRVAMYGLEQVHISVPYDRSVRPYAAGMSFGPKRKMTPNDNTSISAVAVLFTPGPKQIGLHVYHNKYALIPLERGLLATFPVTQYELGAKVRGTTPKWKEV